MFLFCRWGMLLLTVLDSCAASSAERPFVKRISSAAKTQRCRWRRGRRRRPRSSGPESGGWLRVRGSRTDQPPSRGKLQVLQVPKKADSHLEQRSTPAIVLQVNGYRRLPKGTTFPHLLSENKMCEDITNPILKWNIFAHTKVKYKFQRKFVVFLEKKNA